jgi:hypothetical protein
MPGPRWGRAPSSQPIPRAIQSRATRASPHPNDHAPWSPPRASHLMRVSTPAILPRRHPRQPAAAAPRWASLARIHAPYHDPQPPDGRPRRATRLSLLGQAVEPGRSRRLRASQDTGHLRSRLPASTTAASCHTASLSRQPGRSRTRRATTPELARPNREALPCRTDVPRTDPGADRVGRGHKTRGHRTPADRTPADRTPDTRRPDTGTPATGHPDTGARGHADRATNGVASIRTSSTTRPRRRPAGHRTVPPGGRRLRAAINASSATATRPAPPTHPGGDRAPPRRLCTVQARLGALLSCVGFGWYERRAMGRRKGAGCGVRLVRECGWGLFLGC